MKNLFRSLCLFILVLFQGEVRAQVPVMSSYPTAGAVLFLDFDGHTVTGTSWNYMGPIVCNSSGLDNTRIIEIFNRVAEDYRPFNLNVTTDSTKFWAAPANRRSRVIITTSYSWYGAGAGGVSFVGSFTWADNSPSFVFSSLQSYNVKLIAESVSHESGHALGLYHQASYDANCIKTSDYHYGLGSGEIGWAPIMGVGYYKNFTLWNNGPNSYGCTNYQNDLEIITSTLNGFGFRSDDHGNNSGSATLATFTTNQFTASGVIERNTDQDLFKFIIPYNARFQLDAIPYNVGTGNSGSDLDLHVTLYDGSMAPINVYNPGALLSSLVDTTLNSGTYYVEIEGKGNQFAPAYASLGSYSLLARFDNGGIALPLRKLELRGAQNGDIHQLSWMIDADEKIVQQVVEYSSDGRNFESLTEATDVERSYIYKPSSSNGTFYYRLNVAFENGHRYYSNIISLRDNGKLARPRLISNLINAGTIYVSSPGHYSYDIIDLNGKRIGSGQLNNGMNNIQAAAITKGVYVIRFAGDNQQWTDKFLRQ
jgi:hypothetical protein